MKLEFSKQTFEKNSNKKFHENPSGGNRAVACRRTDIHDEANSRFRNYANAPKKVKASSAPSMKAAEL